MKMQVINVSPFMACEKKNCSQECVAVPIYICPRSNPVQALTKSPIVMALPYQFIARSTSCHCSYARIPSNSECDHGQIAIETETHT